MKWFKHYSNAHSHEKIVNIKEKLGLAGYGLYFYLIELISERIDFNEREVSNSLTYSLKHWSKLLGTYKQHLSKMLTTLEENFLIQIENKNNLLKITIPNLLNYCDNHSRNLQATNKRLASNLQADKIRIDKINNSISKDILVDEINSSTSGSPDINDNASKATISACPYEKIVQLFNETLPELSKVKDMTSNRRKNLSTRWKDNWKKYTFKGTQNPSIEGGLEYWKRLFLYIQEKCPFLMGRKTEFKATFDWIIDQNNFQKIIEGNYKEKGVSDYE